MKDSREIKTCECYRRLIKNELRKIQSARRLFIVLTFLRHFNGDGGSSNA